MMTGTLRYAGPIVVGGHEASASSVRYVCDTESGRRELVFNDHLAAVAYALSRGLQYYRRSHTLRSLRTRSYRH